MKYFIMIYDEHLNSLSFGSNFHGKEHNNICELICFNQEIEKNLKESVVEQLPLPCSEE